MGTLNASTPQTLDLINKRAKSKEQRQVQLSSHPTHNLSLIQEHKGYQNLSQYSSTKAQQYHP